MDYDFINQSADRGFLYFKGRDIEELGQGLKVEIISISYWAGDMVGCRVACFFCLDRRDTFWDSQATGKPALLFNLHGIFFDLGFSLTGHWVFEKIPLFVR